jgi:WD40 repeat protein
VTFGRAGNAVVAGNDDGTVLVWDLRKRKDPHVAFPRFAREVQALRYAGRSLLWARSDGSVERQARRDGETSSLPGREGQVHCVAVSADGRLAAWGMKDGSVVLWDVAERKERGRFGVHDHQVWAVAFSADGRTVASVDHFATVKVWDPTTGRERAVARNCGVGHVRALALSPDGRLVAGGGADHAVRVWDARSGAARAVLTGHRGQVWGVAFSPDGKVLASASADATVKLWALSAIPKGNNR